jgi:hypothetical protein
MKGAVISLGGFLLVALVTVGAGGSVAGGSGPSPCTAANLQHAEKIYGPIPLGASLHQSCGQLGSPVVELSIGSTGQVETIEFLRGSRCEEADRELERCLGAWRYFPATCAGEPVPEKASVVIRWGYGAPPDEPGWDACQPLESSWRELLNLSLEHTAEAKATVSEWAERRKGDVIGRLAALLLEEWELEPCDAKRGVPRLVRQPEIDREGIDTAGGYPPLFPVRVKVDAAGAVVEVVPMKPGEPGAWGKRVLSAFRQARFRPALEEGSYVPGEIQLLVSFHP